MVAAVGNPSRSLAACHGGCNFQDDLTEGAGAGSLLRISLRSPQPIPDPAWIFLSCRFIAHSLSIRRLKCKKFLMIVHAPPTAARRVLSALRLATALVSQRGRTGRSLHLHDVRCGHGRLAESAVRRAGGGLQQMIEHLVEHGVVRLCRTCAVARGIERLSLIPGVCDRHAGRDGQGDYRNRQGHHLSDDHDLYRSPLIVTLARERHFGRAAEKCHVSQPTLSVALKKVEQHRRPAFRAYVE